MKKLLILFLGLMLFAGGAFAVQQGQGLADKIGNLDVTTDIYTTAWIDYAGTSTITGWTGTPTATIMYKKVGKTFFVVFNITGASNQTYARFTMPTASANTTVRFTGIAKVTDNGTISATPGLVDMGPDTATVSTYMDFDNGVFTNSGTKTVRGMIQFEAQ